MHETTRFWMDGREVQLTVRGEGDAIDPSWVKTLIDDPQQQHVVHLLAWRYVEYKPGHDHSEVMAALETELSTRFIPVAVEEELAKVA